jgi:hypothetical protein
VQFIEYCGRTYEDEKLAKECLDPKVLLFFSTHIHDQFYEYVTKMTEIRGTPHPRPEDFRQHFEDAGFTDIKIVEKLIDIGPWNTSLSRLLTI